jgi:hypothetical protein
MELADYRHASAEISKAQLVIARGTAMFRGPPVEFGELMFPQRVSIFTATHNTLFAIA